LYAYLTPKVDFNANLTTTNRFFTNDDWQHGRFENFESDHHYESNLESDVRFEIESNHEASQVPNIYTFIHRCGVIVCSPLCECQVWFTTRKRLFTLCSSLCECLDMPSFAHRWRRTFSAAWDQLLWACFCSHQWILWRWWNLNPERALGVPSVALPPQSATVYLQTFYPVTKVARTPS